MFRTLAAVLLSASTLPALAREPGGRDTPLPLNFAAAPCPDDVSLWQVPQPLKRAIHDAPKQTGFVALPDQSGPKFERSRLMIVDRIEQPYGQPSLHDGQRVTLNEPGLALGRFLRVSGISNAGGTVGQPETAGGGAEKTGPQLASEAVAYLQLDRFTGEITFEPQSYSPLRKLRR